MEGNSLNHPFWSIWGFFLVFLKKGITRGRRRLRVRSFSITICCVVSNSKPFQWLYKKNIRPLCSVNVKRVARGDSEALSAGDPSIKSRRDVLMTAIISECAAGAISRLFGHFFFCFLYETELPAVAFWRITGERTQKSLPRQSRIHLIQQQSWIPIWEDSAKPGIMCWDNVVFIGNFFFSVGGREISISFFSFLFFTAAMQLLEIGSGETMWTMLEIL